MHKKAENQSSMTVTMGSVSSMPNGLLTLTTLSVLVVAVLMAMFPVQVRSLNLVANSTAENGTTISNNTVHQRKLPNIGNCNQSITLWAGSGSNSGVLSSPGYPVRYPSGIRCTWLITNLDKNRTKLWLSVLGGSLEDSKNCIFDHLDIFDGMDSSGVHVDRLCGVLAKVNYLSTSGSFFLIFLTDSNYELSGLQASYSVKSSITDRDCNYTIVSSRGKVESPAFPLPYPDSRDCWILVRSPKSSNQLQLAFDLLSLEPSSGCIFDFVTIYDGSTEDADVLGRFCTKPETTMISSSGQILVHFHSDSILNNQGFQLQFATNGEVIHARNKTNHDFECPLVVGEGLSGTVTSPNFPEPYWPNTRCSISLKAQADHYFLITFDDVHLESDEMCSFDSLEIREGSTSDSPLIAQICGKKEPGYAVRTTGPAAFLQFLSDGLVELRGFSMHYRAFKRHGVAGVATETVTVVEAEEVEDEAEEDEEQSRREEVSEWLEGQREETPADVAKVQPPVILAQPENASVPLGRAHMLHCLTNGTNTAVVWLKDHTFVSADDDEHSLHLLANNSLVIPFMSWDDEGTYTCVILSEVGAATINAWISVDSRQPESTCAIEFRRKPSDVNVEEGRNTFLTCQARQPHTVIAWFHDGKPVERSGFRGHSRLLTNGVLALNRVRHNDSGVYRCQITDKHSGCVVAADAHLYVLHKQIDTECGKPVVKRAQNQTRFGKVIAGHNAERGAFPWQAMLWEVWLGSSFCGGSLLNNLWVLTAGHCFTEFEQRYSRTLKADSLLIKLGKQDQSLVETDEQVVKAESIVVHPRYDRITYDNDVALVRLAKPVQFGPLVSPVCLPHTEPPMRDIYDRAGSLATLTGWGTLAEAGSAPVRLQTLRLPLVERRTCVSSTRYTVTRNMFCAGYTERVMNGDACHGDSGGPLTVEHADRWYVIGVVSWGEGCNRPGKYGFYAKVGNYVHWLQSVMK